jgi:membrane associated rhomboid family serine protease
VVRVRLGEEEHTLPFEEWERWVATGRISEDVLVCVPAVTGTKFVPAGELELYHSLRRDATIAYRGRFLAGPPPILTALLVGVQIRIWWLAHLPGAEGWLTDWYTNWTAPTLLEGEIWRPLSAGLLHVQWQHIAPNMLFMAYTGWNLERALGRANLAALFFASVLGGSLLSMFGSPETPSLGASGGIFGLMAASVVFGFARPDLVPERGRRLFGTAIAPYLVLMLWSGLRDDRIDNFGHVGGMVVGAVLVLLLDPPGLQRRARWNGTIHATLVGSTVVLLAFLGLAGPRIMPTVDDATAKAFLSKAPVPPRAEDRMLRFEVPAGWRSGVNAAGDAAFIAPTASRLPTWSVAGRHVPTPTSPEELAQEWRARLVRGWPDATFEPIASTQLAGRVAVRQVAHLTDSGAPRTLTWRGTTRGLWTLQEAWEDEGGATWLAPLRERLQASLTWEEPENLRRARVARAHAPNSVRARLDLAAALVDVGDAQEAFALLDSLIEAQPTVHTHWVALMDAAAHYPDVLHEPDAVLDRALGLDHGSVTAKAAELLDALDQPDTARALLDLAWYGSPGDKPVKRARRSRGMNTLLTEEGLPWTLVHEPWTGRPRADGAAEDLMARDLNLKEARALAASRAKERDDVEQAAKRAVLSADAEAGRLLLTLRFGAPLKDDRSLRILQRELDEAAEGEMPGWLPQPLQGPAWIAAATRLVVGMQGSPDPP